MGRWQERVGFEGGVQVMGVGGCRVFLYCIKECLCGRRVRLG